MPFKGPSILYNLANDWNRLLHPKCVTICAWNRTMSNLHPTTSMLYILVVLLLCVCFVTMSPFCAASQPLLTDPKNLKLASFYPVTTTAWDQFSYNLNDWINVFTNIFCLSGFRTHVHWFFGCWLTLTLLINNRTVAAIITWPQDSGMDNWHVRVHHYMSRA